MTTYIAELAETTALALLVAILAIVGVIELLFRIIAVIVLICSVIGAIAIMVLAMENPQLFKMLFEPICLKLATQITKEYFLPKEEVAIDK